METLTLAEAVAVVKLHKILVRVALQSVAMVEEETLAEQMESQTLDLVEAVLEVMEMAVMVLQESSSSDMPIPLDIE